MKCPQCQKGSFFEGHPYNFRKIGIVKESCEHCQLKYAIEPGFYQGSYYVSYGLGGALFIAWGILKMIFLPNLTYLSTVILMVVTLILGSPLLLAFSKIIWINIFVNYDSGAQK